MTEFYRNPPPEYYKLADASAGQYVPDKLPFHHDLIGRVHEGCRVLEFGCGTAHLCPEIEARGGSYTGIDWSPELLANNREKFPKARFHSPEEQSLGQFDLVASLYTIEHVVDPRSYLETLWEHCAPSGMIAVISPEFVDSAGVAPSIFYGKTPRRFREKVVNFDLIDALLHLLDWRVGAPSWKRKAQAGQPGAFWINMAPRALYDDGFCIDADAVHLVRMADLEQWFTAAGGEIVLRGRDLPAVSEEILAYNAYIVVRKSTGAAE